MIEIEGETSGELRKERLAL